MSAQLGQNLNGLRGEGDNVCVAHLHAVARDAPLAALEVKLTPFSAAQLANAARIRYRCPVHGRNGRQRAAQVSRDIALGPPGGDRVAHHLADALLGARRGLRSSLGLDGAEGSQQLGRLDLVDEPVVDGDDCKAERAANQGGMLLAPYVTLPVGPRQQ